MNLAGRLSISALNQIISSGASFALGLYLVRILTPFEFGLYGIAMAICLLYGGAGNALFLTQMVVHLPEKEHGCRAKYAATMLSLVGIFCLITVIIVAIILVLASLTKLPVLNISNIILATTVASIFNLLKDYIIRLAYSFRREQLALLVNAVWASTLLILVLVLHYQGLLTDSPSALWLFAASNFVSVVAGLLIFRLPITHIRADVLRANFEEASIGGRWALGGTAVIWLQSQAYMYITTFYIGPSGVALANAARMLIAPFSFMVPALTQLFLPRLVDLRKSDEKRMLRASQIFTAFLVGLGMGYIFILWLGAEKIIPLIVGDKYSIEDLVPLVIAWGVMLIFQLARNGASLAMQALKAFRSLTMANIVSATVTILAALWLVVEFDISGAIFAVALGELLFAVMLWRTLITRQ